MKNKASLNPSGVRMVASDSLGASRDGVSEGGRSELAERPVYFADGDSTYRSALAECLRIEGLHVIEFDDLEAALEELALASDVGAALIDADACWAEGATMLERLREAAANAPVAMIASVRNNRREEEALKLGAADYLEKSSSPTIVAKRLRLLIGGVRVSGSTAASSDDAIDVGPLTLRLSSCRALWRGDEAPLTVTEFKIVRLLAGEPGRDFSYREIYDVVHGANFMAGDGPDGYRTNVRSLIRKIRERFRRLDDEFDAIENSPGHGYRWRLPEDGDRASVGALHALTPKNVPHIAEKSAESGVMARTGSEE